MEISARDKKLLVYLIAISIIAGSYFFVAKPLLDKQAILNEEISELQQKVTHYTDIYNNMDNYESQIAEAQTKYNETCNKLFGGLNQDNTIMMVKDLENATDVWIARLSFTEEDVVFGEGIADATAEGDVAADATGEVATNDATEAATDDGGEAAGGPGGGLPGGHGADDGPGGSLRRGHCRRRHARIKDRGRRDELPQRQLTCQASAAWEGIAAGACSWRGKDAP